MEFRVKEGNAFDKKEIIKINALGRIASLRVQEGEEDHMTYFGSAETMNGAVVNDVICSKEDGFAEQ